MRIFAALAAAIGVRMAFTSPLPVQMEEEDRTGEAARVGATALLVGEVLGGSVASYITWQILRQHYMAGRTTRPENDPLSTDEIEGLYRTLQAEGVKYQGLQNCAKRKTEAKGHSPNTLPWKREYIRSWVHCENEIRTSSSGENTRQPDDGWGRGFNDLMPSMVVRPEELMKSVPRPNININGVLGSVGSFGRSMVANARIPKMMPRVIAR